MPRTLCSLSVLKAGCPRGGLCTATPPTVCSPLSHRHGPNLLEAFASAPPPSCSVRQGFVLPTLCSQSLGENLPQRACCDFTDLLGEGHPPHPGRGRGGAWALGTREASKPGCGRAVPRKGGLHSVWESAELGGARSRGRGHSGHRKAWTRVESGTTYCPVWMEVAREAGPKS